MYFNHLKVLREYIVIFSMYEIFNWINLLVIESQKDGLQTPVGISLGK